MKRVAGYIIPVLIILGLQFHNKSDSRDDLRQELIDICYDDSGCTQAVNVHFTRCFEDTYKMPTRYRSARLDLNSLVGCLNQRSGEAYFAFEATK